MMKTMTMMIKGIHRFSLATSILLGMASALVAQEVPPIEDLLDAAANGEPYPVEDTVLTMEDIRGALREACLASETCLERLEYDTFFPFGLIPEYDPDTAISTEEFYLLRTTGQ